MSEKITARQREALDLWAAWLYRQGYTTGQIGAALRLSGSTISMSLARTGIPTRTTPGRREDLEKGLWGERWRACEPPPGSALAAGKLNQNGLLTSALRTWQSRNALAVFANRALEATDAERKDAVAVLEQTIAYATKLQLVLSDPEFAETVRRDPAYRDDVGHRFT
jgi:hypothetical protein